MILQFILDTPIEVCQYENLWMNSRKDQCTYRMSQGDIFGNYPRSSLLIFGHTLTLTARPMFSISKCPFIVIISESPV